MNNNTFEFYDSGCGNNVRINKRIAHLFFPHVFTKAAIPFFKKFFPEYGFDFIIIANPRNSSVTDQVEGSIRYIYSGLKEETKLLIMILKKYDYVIIHSLFFSRRIKLLLSIFYPKLIKKIVWVTWGYDLYYNRGYSLKQHAAYISNNFTKCFFEKKISYFVGIHPVDLRAYPKLIHGKAKLLYAPYRFYLNKEDNMSLKDYYCIPLSEKLKQGEPFTIQIAHRAERELNHIAILNKLQVYKNQNIRILLPLSYGNKLYAQKVENYARSIYGEKVVVLNQMMPYDEYIKVLESVDMLVIDSKRQIALGNIYIMFYMCKKVFLPKESLLSNYFSENGVKIFNSDDIGKMSYRELTADDDLSAGRNYIINFDSINAADVWKDVFNNIS